MPKAEPIETAKSALTCPEPLVQGAHIGVDNWDSYFASEISIVELTVVQAHAEATLWRPLGAVSDTPLTIPI